MLAKGNDLGQIDQSQVNHDDGQHRHQIPERIGNQRPEQRKHRVFRADRIHVVDGDQIAAGIQNVVGGEVIVQPYIGKMDQNAGNKGNQKGGGDVFEFLFYMT